MKVVYRQCGSSAFIWAMAAIWAITTALRGQEVLVTKSSADKLALDISAVRAGGRNGPLFVSIFRDDLEKSGWFRLVRGGTPAFAVSGEGDMGSSSISISIAVANNSTGEMPLRRIFSHQDGDARRLAHVVADAVVHAITGKRGMASARLVLVGDRTGSKELYVCDADGGNLLQWTKDKSISMAPSWLPDGNRVVYVSFLQGFADMYLIGLGSGQRTRISNYPGINMGGDVAPDGKTIALVLSKDGTPDIYLRNINGGKVTRLTNTPWGEASPSWSPDGSKLVFVADRGRARHLYIVDRNGGEPRKITSRSSENVDPDWGANGLIAYCSRRGGQFAVMLCDPANTSHQVISPGDADYEEPSWAPDGRHIFCGRTRGYKSDICMLDINGDPPIRLLQIEGNWRSPACSP